MPLAQLRAQIRETSHGGEHDCVDQLLRGNTVTDTQRQQALELARDLVHQCRQRHHQAGSLDIFLQEFGLSNDEGIALMCLAESLLRIPDEATANKLITEKIQSGDWGSHLGHSDSLFVNASIWGLMLTGKVLPLAPDITHNTGHWLKKLSSRLSEPVVRTAMLQAMRIMGNQYVLGSSIEEVCRSKAPKHTKREQTESNNRYCSPSNLFSFDMLGEGARTEQDAQRYFNAYAHAIEYIGEHNEAGDIYTANGISIKLSALYSRYEYAHRTGVMSVLLPRIQQLALAAKSHNISLSIDAEEARRLDLSLDIFECLARDPKLSDWQGLGFVLQAYQKCAPLVAQWLITLAEETGHRMMVRLVKGAYWDAEIKHAQEQGLADYPVFTRKVNTDLCYQHCAQLLLSAPLAIYPQFATHNAYTLALVLALAEDNTYEFQRLHGMGELLYQQLDKQLRPQQGSKPSIRIYAPVGEHRELLPYLVRRLLENGANSSFVNRFLDQQLPIDALVQNIEPQVMAVTPYRHKNIPAPPDLYLHAGEPRLNSPGIDLANPQSVKPLLAEIENARKEHHLGGPIVAGQLIQSSTRLRPVTSPACNNTIVGDSSPASKADIQRALSLAKATQPDWNLLGGDKRADILEDMAKALEHKLPKLLALITLEAGRTIADALSEVREAIDFCRYYAIQARQHFSTAQTLPGPTGEQNQLSLQGRGVFFCISPWNFPLAIFTGQIAAALAAGNTVIAKPAESTPLVATLAVQLFHQSGLPPNVLHLITGKGDDVGKLVLTDKNVSGVVLTGSTDTAHLILKQLADRSGPIVPLIAETGGQNVMLVDSTAQPEQLVDDVIRSAFLSAGQRCSALRVLYLQEEIADDILTMLANALQTYTVGDPSKLETDIGPVIDEHARQKLLHHVQTMTKENALIRSLALTEEHQKGCFIAPHIFEIDSLTQLPEEVFGPILHVIRYSADELDDVIQQINDSGFGLTLGIHSRIQAFAEYIFQHTQVGNTYINRNMVGAVVGTNPFGGCGLSGTGPKAGGPHYLFRFATEKTRTENLTARGGNTVLFGLTEE